MTYDALLTIHGWDHATFQAASPALHSAARWALYAKQMVPLVKRAEEVLDMETPSDPKGKGRIGIAKMAAKSALEVMRPLLFPEDDDG